MDWPRQRAHDIGASFAQDFRTSGGFQMQEDLRARRARVMEAIERARPMSIGGQIVVLVFMAAMVLLVASISLLKHAPNPTPFLASTLLIAIFFVAMNAMRTQRQLSAVLEVVMRDVERP
jgi:hypothetical protein